MDLTCFKLTENEQERLSIAEEIINKNRQIYNENVVKSIKDTVRHSMNTEDQETIEKYYLLSVYYYWAYGSSAEEFFMFDLLHKTHDEVSQYVTVHKKCLYRDRFNKKEDVYLLNDKYIAYSLLKDEYKRDVVCINGKDDFDIFCDFVKKHPKFVVKPRSLRQGHGVFCTEITGDHTIEWHFNELLNTGKQYTEKYNNYQDTAFVLEEVIEQVPEFAKFHPQSINGVRINTFRNGDEVKTFKPWFKIGRFGQFVTSAIYGTFDAGIDAETGIVNTPGATEMREYMNIHPDTGERILGFQIPKWQEAIELAVQAAKKFDTLRMIGWDLVLTPKGWCIMEGNTSGAFMWELYEDKGSQSEIEEIFGWHLTKQFWWEEPPICFAE